MFSTPCFSSGGERGEREGRREKEKKRKNSFFLTFFCLWRAEREGEERGRRRKGKCSALRRTRSSSKGKEGGFGKVYDREDVGITHIDVSNWSNPLA